MTYGKSGSGNYAVARQARGGVWDAVEAVGDFYRIVEFDAIPECDWDRIDELEGQLTVLR